MYTAYEGQTITCSQAFVDERGQPVQVKRGYPVAKLMYGKDLVAKIYPEQQTALFSLGIWSATVTIPEIGLVEATPLHLKWKVYDSQGNLYRTTEVILVQPSQKPSIGDLVVLADEPEIKLLIPVALEPQHTLDLSFYRHNTLLVALSVNSGQRQKYATYTSMRFARPSNLEPMLSAYFVLADYTTFSPDLQRLMLNLWVVTPQILQCMNALEATLNKAKLDNVIPQLEYTQADLLQYLERGLNLFNGYSPNLTDFNGLNMQGALFDALLLCASYYALGAQLLAEGMLAFDFSGQAVTLNVDRTPALEGALGRVEAQMNERIPKLKQMLLRRGVSGGTGANAVGSSQGFGHVVLSNSPTTSKTVFRPGYMNYYR